MTSRTEHHLTERLGGPLGRHGIRTGPWFDPGPAVAIVATLLWLVLVVRQLPCQVKDPGDDVNAFLRLCYSDIGIYYRGNGVSEGALPYLDFEYDQPVLTGVLAALTRFLARLFGARVSADPQAVVDGAASYLAAAAVVLFVCFLALLTALMLMGARSQSARTPNGRVRSWDALMVAGAPVVLASGLINWDLFAVALATWAMLGWARGRPVAAGVLFGLAAAARFTPLTFYPFPIVIAIAVLCVRAGRLRSALATAGAALATFAGLNLVLAVAVPDAVRASMSSSSALGSVWYVLDQAGLTLTGTGVIAAVLIVGCWAGLAWLALRAPRRPRVGQLGYLMMVTPMILGSGYPPQAALWLLPLVVLARPNRLDFAIFNLGEVVYWLAVWIHLDGALGPAEGPGPALYWSAVGLRIACQLFVAVRVVHDIRRPWEDPVRVPFVDDPIGGVLDHAPDAFTISIGDEDADILDDQLSIFPVRAAAGPDEAAPVSARRAAEEDL